jgi:hypothetical protein
VASLRIRRAGYFGIARKLKVLVDGQVVGSVGRAADPIDVSPGTHTVAVKMDWVKSPALEIAVAEGETWYSRRVPHCSGRASSFKVRLTSPKG